MARHTFPARHSTNTLIRFADLLTARQADCPTDLRGRCAELWLDWTARRTAASMSSLSTGLSGFVDVWSHELRDSELSPLSTAGVHEYLRQLP